MGAGTLPGPEPTHNDAWPVLLCLWEDQRFLIFPEMVRARWKGERSLSPGPPPMLGHLDVAEGLILPWIVNFFENPVEGMKCLARFCFGVY